MQKTDAKYILCIYIYIYIMLCYIILYIERNQIPIEKVFQIFVSLTKK